MRILKSLLAIILLAPWPDLQAQPKLQTGGGKTMASVMTTTGLVSFLTLDQKKIRQRLSFPEKSFLSVKIDGEIFTNHDAPATPAKPLNVAASLLTGDTIITTWELPKLTLTQHVFPRYTEHGMKIAVHYSAANKTKLPVKVETQYLLDVQVINDGRPYFETFSGVNDHWRKYLDSIPTHIMMMPVDLAHTYPGNFDIIGLLSLTDSLSPALKPSMLIGAHWPLIEQVPFVDSSYTMPNTEVTDLGMLLRWKEITLPDSMPAVLGGFSYGAADFKFCDNNLLMIIPDTIEVPVFPRSNVLRVPIYVLNQSSGSTNPPMTFNTSGVIRFEGGETDTTVPSAFIPALGARGIELKIAYDSTAQQHTQSTGSISNANCEKSIIFLSNVPDTVAPSLRVLSEEVRDCHRRIDTLIATEDLRSGMGLAGMTISNENYSLKYLTAAVYPSKEQRVVFTVQDSMQDAHALINTIDQSGNKSTLELNYCTTPDKLVPKVTITEQPAGLWTIAAHDGRPWDRLLDKIETSSRNNVTANVPNDVSGKTDATATVSVVDPTRPAGFCVTVYDIAGNATQKTCYTYLPSSSVEAATSILSASISPNPATDHVTLTLPSSASHDITITDILGRVVWSGRSSDTQLMINTARFDAGKYVIRVQGEGEAVSVPMVIMR
jgi:hypothetical protein